MILRWQLLRLVMATGGMAATPSYIAYPNYEDIWVPTVGKAEMPQATPKALLRALTPARVGQITPVAVALPKACPSQTTKLVYWTDKHLPVPWFPHMQHQQVILALLPVGIDWQPGSYLLQVHCGSAWSQSFAIPVWRKPYPRDKLSVAPRFSHPPAARVAAEQVLIKQALASSSNVKLWQGQFVAPKSSRQTAGFGTRRIYNGRIASTHLGQDFAGGIGTPIVASNAGKVALVANNFFYIGNAVFVDHGLGLFSMYFHMHHTQVQVGQTVHKGDVLGYLGATGRVTGPHLHVGVRLQGLYQDPQSLWAQDWENIPLDKQLAED